MRPSNDEFMWTSRHRHPHLKEYFKRIAKFGPIVGAFTKSLFWKRYFFLLLAIDFFHNFLTIQTKASNWFTRSIPDWWPAPTPVKWISWPKRAIFLQIAIKANDPYPLRKCWSSVWKAHSSPFWNLCVAYVSICAKWRTRGYAIRNAKWEWQK